MKIGHKKTPLLQLRTEVDCTLIYFINTVLDNTFIPRKATPLLSQAGLLTRDHPTFCTFPTNVSGFMQISSRSQRRDRG
jgi:hypothetical protein